MNILLVEAAEIQENCVLLKDHRAKHIVKVLRSEPGDILRVGEIDGKMGLARITAINKKHPFSVELQLNLSKPPPVQPTLDLVLALPRPIMLRRILSQGTALGVGRFYLINASRVEKSFWKSSLVERQEYRSHLLLGLEQAVDTRLPEVEIFPRFKQFIDQSLPEVLGEYTTRICADPQGTESLAESIARGSGRIVLAIGPEGGWVDHELQRFREKEFRCCSLGQRILKVDTAVIALHARVTALLEAGL
jgi:16S rRNA (uracil1498-N3)-methyltransferase